MRAAHLFTRDLRVQISDSDDRRDRGLALTSNRCRPFASRYALRQKAKIKLLTAK